MRNLPFTKFEIILTGMCLSRALSYLFISAYAASLAVLMDDWTIKAARSGSIASGFHLGSTVSLVANLLVGRSAGTETPIPGPDDPVGHLFAGLRPDGPGLLFRPDPLHSFGVGPGRDLHHRADDSGRPVPTRKTRPGHGPLRGQHLLGLLLVPGDQSTGPALGRVKTIFPDFAVSSRP